MKVYEITVDGEGTDMLYVADSKQEAIKKHIKRCAELYWVTFAKKPDISFFYGVNAKSVKVYN